MADHVRITDVSPRDGLQNEPLRADNTPIPTTEKARLINALTTTGVDEIEITSFVSPKWIPQLGDADQLCKLLHTAKPDGISFSALVPNERGMASLLEANHEAGTNLIDKASVFTAASETFSKKNTNATIAQTLERFAPVFAQAKKHNLAVRAYISCVIECPFEGVILPEAVATLAKQLIDMGADEIDLGDTIGAACTETTAAMLAAVTSRVPQDKLVLHLHDTFGRAPECVRAALAMGIRSFDGSAAGLGGCPYASTESSRAPGNIATETLTHVIQHAGYTTGIVFDALKQAAAVANEITA